MSQEWAAGGRTCLQRVTAMCATAVPTSMLVLPCHCLKVTARATVYNIPDEIWLNSSQQKEAKQIRKAQTLEMPGSSGLTWQPYPVAIPCGESYEGTKISSSYHMWAGKCGCWEALLCQPGYPLFLEGKYCLYPFISNASCAFKKHQNSAHL